MSRHEIDHRVCLTMWGPCPLHVTKSARIPRCAGIDLLYFFCREYIYDTMVLLALSPTVVRQFNIRVLKRLTDTPGLGERF